jgi:hypothetical protein
MAWVSTNLVSISGDGDASSGAATETRVYQVKFTDTTANSVDARNASGVPAYGAQLGTTNLYVTSKDAEQDAANRKYWLVRVVYKATNADTSVAIRPPGATKWAVQVNIASVPVQVPVTKDINGKIIANTLGEPIQPMLTKVIHDTQLNITYTTDSPDIGTILACLEHVNAGGHTIAIGGGTYTIPAGSMKLDAWALNESYDSDGNKQCQVTLQFLLREDFKERVPNVSYYLEDSGSGDLVPILDGNNQPVAEPKYIAGDGLGVLETGDDVYLNEFVTVPSTSFATLLSEIP